MSEKPGWGQMGGGPPRPPEFVTKQVANLAALQKLLEDVVNQKQHEVAALQEQLIRLKHGGGS